MGKKGERYVNYYSSSNPEALKGIDASSLCQQHEELWHGTDKSIEGHVFPVVFYDAKGNELKKVHFYVEYPNFSKKHAEILPSISSFDETKKPADAITIDYLSKAIERANAMLDNNEKQKMIAPVPVYAWVPWISDCQKAIEPQLQEKRALFVDKKGNVLFSIPYYLEDEKFFAQLMKDLYIDPTLAAKAQFSTNDKKEKTIEVYDAKNACIKRLVVDELPAKVKEKIKYIEDKAVRAHAIFPTHSIFFTKSKISAIAALIVAGGGMAYYGWQKREKIREYIKVRMQKLKQRVQKKRSQPAL